MKLLTIRKFLSWFTQRKENVIKRIDFFLGKLIFDSSMTLEEHEKLILGDLFEKIEKEPNNPYYYYLRGNMRMSKQVNNPLGVVEDFIQVIKIISIDRKKYPDIDLYFCHYSICKKANIYGDNLTGNKEFIEAAKYYKLSISNGQQFLQYENRNAMYDGECEIYVRKSSSQLILIQNST